MKRLKRYFTVVLALSMIFISLSGLVCGADELSGWKTDGWTKNTSNGETTLTGVPGKTMNLLYSNGAVSNNCLSFDIRMLDSYGTVDGCIGAAYKCTNGYQYFYEYNTVSKLVRVRRLGNDGSDIQIGKAQSRTLELERWYNFRLVFDSGCIKWYIDGEELYSITETYDDPFTGGSCYIQGYYSTPELKNIKMSNVKVEKTEKTVYDFEFSSEASVKDFKAVSGSVSYSDGKLVYTVSKSGSYLESPTITVAQGTAYSALMSVKNTVFVRLKNSTGAKAFRVWFVTSDDGEYSQSKSKLFDVAPNGNFESLYFNFSDNPYAKGYLRGFRIEPVGADKGTVEIDAVTFEREKAFYDYAGEIISCTSDGTTVKISGELNGKAEGTEAELYELDVTDYTESAEGLVPLAKTALNGNKFSFEIPFYNGKVSRLSSLFIVKVGGVKVSDRFSIDNYRDFQENIYEFTLPDYTVKVTDEPFSAKGDAFNDDTDAIQAAIDHVSGKGGGVVIIPGDSSYYGRRYVATNIKMKDNVELVIERGAVIWQSSRKSDYKYDVALGHDVSISGVNWTHAASCHNYPLIQGDGVKNVKVTGGGILRCVDTGGENLDSVGSTIWTGCENRIHIIPIGFYMCENVEISDIGLRRTNNYHINMRACNNVCIRNVVMSEVTCASGDGISATVGTKNMLIDRCFFYSNDDAVTICSTYDDPRGLAWWHARPGEDNCIDTLTVVHSNLYGGHGITFITWGTDAPDLSLQEIKNITVNDCVLGGACSVGAWPDNPYYGKGFDNTETDDFSPVKNVLITGNRYKSATTIECIRATNFISDCGIKSADNFVNGDFERKNGKKTWVSGLSNWSTDIISEGASVSAVQNKDGYEGKINGEALLYQGLYMTAGEHTFTADVNLVSGGAQLTVYNATDGLLIASCDITSSGVQSLKFTSKKAGVYRIGIKLQSADSEACIDNANVTTEPIVYPQFFTNDFGDEGELCFSTEGWELSENYVNGRLSTPSGRTGMFTLTADYTYTDFDILVNMRVNDVLSDIDSNFGLSLRRKDGNNQISVEFNGTDGYLQIRKFKNGVAEVIKRQEGYRLEPGQWYTVGVRAEGEKLELFVNGVSIAAFNEPNGVTEGKILLAAYNTDITLDRFSISKAGELDQSGIIPPPSDETVPMDTETSDIQTETDEAQTTDEPATDTKSDTSDVGTEAIPKENGTFITAAVISACAAAVALICLVIVFTVKKKNGRK